MASDAGIIDISFIGEVALIQHLRNSMAMYNNQILGLSGLAFKLHEMQVNYGYDSKELDAAISDIMKQVEDYEIKKGNVAIMETNLMSYQEEVKDIELAIAKRLNDDWGDFCDEKGIEYDDPEEYSVGEFFGDVWDGVCSVYEQFEAVIDFVIDAALLIVAVAAVITAIGTFALTGGLFAGLVLAASCFALYESTCNFAASSLAFGCTVLGMNEQAAFYLEMRDGNAGKYVFTGLVGALTGGSETAKKIASGLYTIVGVAASIINIADIGKNIGTVYTGAGKGWNGVKAVGKNLFMTKKTDSPVDEAMEMFTYSKGISKFGIDREVSSLMREMDYIRDVGKFATVADNFRGFLEADTLFKGGKEISTVLQNIPGSKEGFDVVSKLFEIGNAIDEGDENIYGME